MAKSSAEAPGMAQILDGEDEELDPLLCLAQNCIYVAQLELKIM